MLSTDAVCRARTRAALILALPALAACGSLATGYDQDAPITPSQQYSVQVEETPDRVALTPHAEGLSPAQRVALIAFVSRWREASEAGDIAVQVPGSGADPAAATRTATETLGALQALGVPSARVRTGDYPAPPGATARVMVSFSSLEARGPDCSRSWNNVTSTGANEATEHFGCAVTANFAAQVADPRDFLRPAGSTSADAARRTTVLGKYRAGEITSTPRDDQAAGVISGAIK